MLPEALEKWPVSLMEKLLPRHMQIIYDINWRFLEVLKEKFGEDWERISRLSIIEEGQSGEKYVPLTPRLHKNERSSKQLMPSTIEAYDASWNSIVGRIRNGCDLAMSHLC